MTPFVLAFAATAVLTPLVILLARALGWVAKPRADRWHSRPTALMGGVAICAGTVLGWLLDARAGEIAPVALPALGMFVLGFVDDRFNLRPHHKLVGQLAAAAALIGMGVRFESLPLPLSLPLTLFWVLAITNAVNLLDNMDGLAAGVCAIAALVLAGYSGGFGPDAGAVLAVAGACVGFLLYNFSPARIFMGDCGSMFLGFALSGLAIQGAQRAAPNLVLSLLVPVAVLAIPIFDTTLVSIARTLAGRSIAQGGRDHSSHRLVSLGLSERGTVLVLYAFTATFGGLALASTRLPLMVVLLLASLLLVALAVLGLFLGFLKVYQSEAAPPGRIRTLGGRVQFTRQRFQMLLDIFLVPIAFVGAHLLRFEGEPSDAILTRVFTLLPLVLVLKLVGLSVCRAYRGVWRVAGLTDALRATAGSTLGSLLLTGVLMAWLGFQDLSRAALIVDWIVFSGLVVCARLGYVLLRELFGMLPARTGPRVLMLGGGPEALSLAQRFRDPLSPTRATVVGILDEDPGYHGRALNGIPVLGAVEGLPEVVERERVQRCVLTVSPTSRAGRDIVEYCRRQGVTLYVDLETPLENTLAAE